MWSRQTCMYPSTVCVLKSAHVCGCMHLPLPQHSCPHIINKQNDVNFHFVEINSIENVVEGINWNTLFLRLQQHGTLKHRYTHAQPSVCCIVACMKSWTILEFVLLLKTKIGNMWNYCNWIWIFITTLLKVYFLDAKVESKFLKHKLLFKEIKYSTCL